MKKYTLFFSYLMVGLFLFFGNYSDRVARSQFLGRTIFFPLTYFINDFKNIRELQAENEILQMEIGRQKFKINDLENQLIRYEHSHIEFELTHSAYIFADVLGFSGDFFGRTLVVSKGLRDGVQQNNAVFSTRGIVGKVVTAYQNFSVVLPINHSNSKLAVLNKNSGVQGILIADVYSNIAMEYMRFGSNIAIGDTVVTSNLSQVFPAHFPVGTVSRLEASPDALYFRAIVQPFNQIANLQFVYILLNKKEEINEIEFESDY